MFKTHVYRRKLVNYSIWFIRSLPGYCVYGNTKFLVSENAVLLKQKVWKKCPGYINLFTMSRRARINSSETVRVPFMHFAK